MPFQYILANLLAQVDGAIGVLFLDDSGETIDSACSDFTPYQMQVLGAYLGIYMRQLERIMDESSMGEPRLIHIEKEAMHIYAAALPDGYYLVLVQRHPAVVGLARRRLGEAAAELQRNLFED